MWSHPGQHAGNYGSRIGTQSRCANRNEAAIADAPAQARGDWARCEDADSSRSAGARALQIHVPDARVPAPPSTKYTRATDATSSDLTVALDVRATTEVASALSRLSLRSGSCRIARLRGRSEVTARWGRRVGQQGGGPRAAAQRARAAAFRAPGLPSTEGRALRVEINLTPRGDPRARPLRRL